MRSAGAVLYKGSKRKAAFACLGSLGFLLAGCLLLNADSSIRHSAEFYHAIGWGTITLFGGFLPLAVIWLIRPPRVSIDQLGFSIQQPWATHHYLWADIEEVWAHYQGAHSWVVWTLRDQRTRPWWRLTRKYDGILIGPWNCAAEEIAWEMNKARR